MSSAICFNLNQSKIFSSGNGLNLSDADLNHFKLNYSSPYSGRDTSSRIANEGSIIIDRKQSKCEKKWLIFKIGVLKDYPFTILLF